MPPVPAAQAERSEALAALLARVALGDRVAFAALYEHTSAHLLGVILRICADRAAAEDVLQEVFINVWRMGGSFEAARSQPMTWLTSIARHRAIDSLRRRKGEPVTTSTTSVAADGEETDLLDSHASPGAGPLELLLQAAAAQQVDHCLQGLSADQRQCVALTYYQGLSHSEVAEHLGQPLGSVKSWVRRALLALKACLDKAGARLASSGSTRT